MKHTYYELRDAVYKYGLEVPIESLLFIKNSPDECNGCGAKNGIKFPNNIWFVNIVWACYIHDADWALATCYEDLVAANERFDNNLKEICDAESNCFMIWFRRMRIAKYVTGVELYGTPIEAKKRGFIGKG